MFKRIGILSWWIGAAIAVLMLYLIGAGMLDHAPCRDLLASQARLDAQSEASYTKFKQEHPNSDSFALTIAWADSQAGGADNLEKVQACKRYEGPYLPVFFSIILVICFWSVAFVLGGSFWRPPVAR